jgi:hypothetical protein
VRTAPETCTTDTVCQLITSTLETFGSFVAPSIGPVKLFLPEFFTGTVASIWQTAER